MHLAVIQGLTQKNNEQVLLWKRPNVPRSHVLQS